MNVSVSRSLNTHSTVADVSAWFRSGGFAVDQIGAAIFDFDGTLVDTMPLHFEAYRRVLAEEGIVLTLEEFNCNIGGNGRETIPKLLDGRASSLTPEEIHSRKKLLVNELFAAGPIPVLAAAQLLPEFAGHLPMALASSGSRPGIEIILARFNWRHYFGAVVSGEDTAHGKPAPDLFLLAAEKLAVPPATCIVFEDTEAGLQAAANAGMRSIDVHASEAQATQERSR